MPQITPGDLDVCSSDLLIGARPLKLGAQPARGIDLLRNRREGRVLANAVEGDETEGGRVIKARAGVNKPILHFHLRQKPGARLRNVSVGDPTFLFGGANRVRSRLSQTDA